MLALPKINSILLLRVFRLLTSPLSREGPSICYNYPTDVRSPCKMLPIFISARAYAFSSFPFMLESMANSLPGQMEDTNLAPVRILSGTTIPDTPPSLEHPRLCPAVLTQNILGS